MVSIIIKEWTTKIELVPAVQKRNAAVLLRKPGRLASQYAADEELAKQTGESARTVQRFVRLNNLIPELLNLIDEKKIAFNPAVELSYMKPEEQKDFFEAMELAQTTPSL